MFRISDSVTLSVGRSDIHYIPGWPQDEAEPTAEEARTDGHDAALPSKSGSQDRGADIAGRSSMVRVGPSLWPFCHSIDTNHTLLYASLAYVLSNQASHAICLRSSLL